MKTNSGFGVIDSLLALALFATIMVGILAFDNKNLEQKDARILANQTSVYAEIFARFMNNKFKDLNSHEAGQVIIITPDTIKNSGLWPQELIPKNIYQQTPCVSLIKNVATHDMEGIMYYVGGRDTSSKHHSEIVRSASVILGSKGGVFHNGTINGNSGWRLSEDSEFLTQAANKCGAPITNNSLVVNLDLLPNWNQNLQPMTAIMRGVDLAYSGNNGLPGHVSNANTPKSNLYFSGNHGVILDNTNPTNPVKLAIQYSGTGTLHATLGLGSGTPTTLIADTLQPSILARAGDPCNYDEVGQVVVDNGLANDTNNVLARSTLVCTVNQLLCGDTIQCYLPSIANRVILQNNSIGLATAPNQFICPKNIPFASNASIVGGQASGYYYMTNLGNQIGCTYATATDGNGYWRPDINNPYSCIIPFISGGCNGGCGGYDGQEIRSFGQYKATGNPTYQDFTSASVGTSLVPLIGSLNNYRVNIGYMVNQGDVVVDCDSICSQLPPVANQPWFKFDNSNQPFYPHNSVSGYVGDTLGIYGKNSCGCFTYSNNDGNWATINGLAIVVLDHPKVIINKVMCSNMPTYSQ